MEGLHDGQAISLIHPKHSTMQHQQLAVVHELAGYSHPPLHAQGQMVCSITNTIWACRNFDMDYVCT